MMAREGKIARMERLIEAYEHAFGPMIECRKRGCDTFYPPIYCCPACGNDHTAMKEPNQ